MWKEPEFIFVVAKGKWSSELLNKNPKTILEGLHVVHLLERNLSSLQICLYFPIMLI